VGIGAVDLQISTTTIWREADDEILRTELLRPGLRVPFTRR
jgi:hypothetical protein